MGLDPPQAQSGRSEELAANIFRRESSFSSSSSSSSPSSSSSSDRRPRSKHPEPECEPLVGGNKQDGGPGIGNTQGVGEAAQDTDLVSLAKDTDEGSCSEMEYAGSGDDFNDDEEAGLTTQQRKKRGLLRKKRREEADSKDITLSVAQKHLADKHVARRLAVNVVFILLWYLFSVSISLYNNWMFDPKHLDFSYPLFTTSLHMLVQFSLASSLLYFFPQLRPKNPAAPQATTSMTGGAPNTSPVVTRLFYFTRLVPCGTATSLDIGLGNMSLKFISLTFLTMCKSSTLGFVLLFALILGLETPSMKLIMIICTMTVGVVMMVADEATFNVIGFSLIIASAFFSGFRWALTQLLLLRHPATANPFSTLFFLTPIMFVSLLVLALLIEGPSQILTGLGILTDQFGTLRTLAVLIFPGTLAFCMIASEFALLRRSSVVTLSICGIFKEVITIAAAGILYDDRLTLINVAGLVVTTCCIATYNYMKITTMRKEAQKDIAEHPSELEHESDDEFGRRDTREYHNSEILTNTAEDSPYRPVSSDLDHPGSSSRSRRG
ncbi:nucleotide-sugar transporter [Coccidioides immitis RS]|uniref:Nucleotide-sugar transporter n=4 Tax=Coccidioides immitis TaxID=5501 RepID=J3KIK1_COCIM|nr:nucleotide-sugar transporter [Coccidioides immitis RS]KMP01086.1 solute carrier family protein 35 member C2 [Coccidioides immitis RMSCC 2394]KMU74333.1 solute carrier family 35 member C2 [Coccidioides immitis RMSCC 3703]KMU83595.1 solute carrier family 35 member C2 [Coccidioides immitis H538.4]TPX25993.1 Triose-phosphate Transporter [Coccidioides immitis]EAS35801.3 nucleotide-sugar transporter [Coccidioides immitis RS]